MFDLLFLNEKSTVTETMENGFSLFAHLPIVKNEMAAFFVQAVKHKNLFIR